MAFTTTQTLDSILLNNLLFRNTANAPISSFYTIYANGRGQTFWGPSVQPENLSTFSTGIFSQLSSFSTTLLTLSSSFTTLSSQTFPNSISSLTSQLTSTSEQFTTNYINLNNQFITLSNNTNVNFNLLTSNLTTSVLRNTSTTIGVVTSTISGISSIAEYTSSFYGLLEEFGSGSSTLSTAVYLEEQGTISTLSTYISTNAGEILLSSFIYTDAAISSLSSILTTSDEIVILSTTQNLALLGYASTFTSTISTGFGILSTQAFGLSNSTISTQTWITSTLSGLSTSVSSLLTLSSFISTQVYNQIVNYTLPLFIAQDTKFSRYTSTLLNQISSISSFTSTSYAQILSISTYTNQSISTISSANVFILNQISTLSREFSVLTTSSILAEVYDSFYLLSTYTSLLVQSTINTMDPFRSSIFFSTSVQNMSSGLGYYNQFVSSIYLSTISTMIPITSTFVSSLITNIYSTGSVALLSSINSTIFGKSTEFQSTNSSLTQLFVLSSQAQFASSIASLLSTPTGVQLSTFSRISAAAISTFQGQGSSTLRGQSSIFGTYYATNTSSQSTQTRIGTGIVSTLSTSFVQYSSTFTSLIQRIQISSINQFTTQNTQFISSMGSYQSQFNIALPSTNTVLLNRTISSATGTLVSITNSTNTLYTRFANTLIAAASSFSISTLFTNQVITLTSTNFMGTLDFAGFTNFTINVRAPLVSGSSNYRITYNSDQVSNLNYRRGFITIDVSTVTATYSNNSGRLCLDTYRWGLPTTIYNEFYPGISSADYTALYSYTILNNIIYTNLINVFPRLRIISLTIVSNTNTSVNGSFWRGTPIAVTWSNYSFFPIGAIGAPSFNADVNVDIFYNNNLVLRNGPYPFNVNSAIINLPYLTGAIPNPAPVQLRTYIVGRPLEAIITNVNIIMPTITRIQITPVLGKFITLQEIELINDSNQNILRNQSSIISLFNSSGNTDSGFLDTSGSIFFVGLAGLDPFSGVVQGLTAYIPYDNHPDFNFGNGDFTLETFINLDQFGWNKHGGRIFYWGDFTLPTPFTVFALRFQGVNETFGSLSMIINNNLRTVVTGFTFNVWHHVAVTKQSGVIRIFFNGVQTYSTNEASDVTNTLYPFVIGGVNLTLQQGLTLFGNLTKIRVVKGTAVYTSNFSVPRAPLENIPGTSLLLLVNTPGTNKADLSRFFDSSSNRKIARVGAGNFSPATNTLGNYFVLDPSNGTPGFSIYRKNNLVDGDPNTITVGPTRLNNPDSSANLQINTNYSLGTNISTILIYNIPSSSNFFRGGVGDGSTEINNAQMQVTVTVGLNQYVSTLVLNSNMIQSFQF